MDQLAKAFLDLQRFMGPRVRENVALSKYATYKIGGPARIFAEPQDQSELIKLIEYVQKSGITFFVLGSGSNLLFDDHGFEGVVIYLGPYRKSQITVLSEDDQSVLVRVPAQFSKAQLLQIATQNNWAGLEFSAGIPGTLGGAVFMNAGTKWGSYSDVIEQVDIFNFNQGIIRKSCSEMGFKYRGHGEPSLGKEAIVLSVDLKLRKISSDDGSSKNLVQEILAYRGDKQPLERPNCGSVFKNPVNSVKGAGRLIEASGLKSKIRGGAMVSDKHANFILNVNLASSDDVRGLIDHIQDEVYKQHSVTLEKEVIFV